MSVEGGIGARTEIGRCGEDRAEQGTDQEFVMVADVDCWFEYNLKYFLKENLSTRETTCVNESMSRFHDLGDSWSTAGLPHSMSLDQKVQSGYKI